MPGLKADPPVIFFSQTPAVLVNLDGDPIWSPIEKNDLKFAVNTNWDLFEHEPTKTFYLRHNESWLKATDLKGAWTAAGQLPASFKALPADESFKEVKAALPGKSLPANQRPTVYVSTVPAELILLTRRPQLSAGAGAKELLWVSNTESDVFRLGKTGPVYYLVTGRWFSAPDFKGPWTFATPKLPEDFKRIPDAHERSRVLASVPGTDQAIEAVMLRRFRRPRASIARRSKRRRWRYQGEPQFAQDRRHLVAARREYRQGHHSRRRHLLLLQPGRVVRRQVGERSVDGRDDDSGRGLQDPRELAGASRDLRGDRRG